VDWAAIRPIETGALSTVWLPIGCQFEPSVEKQPLVAEGARGHRRGEERDEGQEHVAPESYTEQGGAAPPPLGPPLAPPE